MGMGRGPERVSLEYAFCDLIVARIKKLPIFQGGLSSWSPATLQPYMPSVCATMVQLIFWAWEVAVSLRCCLV